jgi:cysteine desulfurase/selenocysteine lyase
LTSDQDVARLGSRALFPTLEPFAYLNHSAISPLSAPVVGALQEVAQDYARRGLGAFVRWRDQREALRGQLAGLIGAQARDVALVPNTSHAVLYVALCFPWAPGDRVVVLEGEFPTNVTPWQRASALFGVELVWLKAAEFGGEGVGLQRLEEVLRGGVRLVATSAVQFQTGLRMPWEEMAALCGRYGAQLFVDAIQAVGSVPVDVAVGIDYLACGSHKWLMGPEGAGFLYVSPARVAALRPHAAAWLSHEEALKFLFEGPGELRYDRPIKAGADFLELGAPQTAICAGLGAAVSLLAPLGIQNVYNHIQDYLDPLEAGLVARGFASERDRDPRGRSGILSVKAPEGLAFAQVAEGLARGGVSCSTPDGRLRFAPHWPNHVSEVPRVLEVLDEVLESLAGGAV